MLAYRLLRKFNDALHKNRKIVVSKNLNKALRQNALAAALGICMVSPAQYSG